MTAYGAYSSLKSRFNIPSWLFLLSRWSDVAQAPDASDSISASYEALKRSLLDLEERLGGWSTDKLLSLCFHSSLRRFQQPIADAMDARLAIALHMRILPADILNLASRLHQSATSTDSTQTSVMGISSQQGARGNRGGITGRGRGGVQRGGGANNSLSRNDYPADAWGKKHITPKFPCNVCWEWGHWAPDCPRTTKNLPPLDDPRPSNPDWKPKKSFWHRFLLHPKTRPMF
jgi:hypothetical protein